MIPRWVTSQTLSEALSAFAIAEASERASGGGTALETCSTCADRFPSKTNFRGKP